ncbi:MAG TPA: hypothetical protein VKY33_07390, partial [Flavobacterium sp.]|nr:hypothetical protein [Flavobacterium sp.]
IAERNDTAYDLTYEKIHFSVLKNSMSINNVLLKPKENTNIKKDIDFFGEIAQISVSGVNFYELIKNKNLKAFTISIVQPDITLLQSTKKDTLSSTSKLATIVDIDKINIEKAHLKVMNSSGDSLLHEMFNFNAEIDGIHMGTYTIDKDIPFTYTDYSFKIDSLYSVVNDLQFAKTNSILIDKENIVINNFKLLPYVSSKDFRSRKINSSTRLLVDVPKLQLKNTDWGYEENDLYVNIGNVFIDSVLVQILDQKEQTLAQQPKNEHEKTVQPLIPFRLNIEELDIKQSSFNSLGTFDVSNVNIKVKGISSQVQQQLVVQEFQLTNPKFVQTPKKRNKPKNNRPIRLNDVILIDKLLVKEAQYILKDKSGKKEQLIVNDFQLSLNNIRVDDATVLENIPFTYTDPLLTTGKVMYDTNGTYKIDVTNVTIKEKNALVGSFKMKPKISRKQHSNRLKYAEDYYNLSVNAIQFNNFNWGFDAENEFFIKFKEVTLNQMDAQIYRDISVPLNPKENHLYSYRLRTMKFPFEVEMLKIKNSKLVYQEDTATSQSPGKLVFSNFNLTVNHLYSGYKKTRGPKTQIFVNTKFMQQGDLVASWQFDIMDQTDKFNINGNLKNFPAPAMNPFLKPYLNVEAKGKIDKMAFNFSGNNEVANGDYAMNFNDLKMTLFNKDNQERKLLTAAANIVVRTDTDGLKKTEIKEVSRHKQKSFFNYLWLCIMQGLKQTVI